MKEINAEELKGNLIEMINKKWALVTAGDHEKGKYDDSKLGFLW